MKKSFVLLVAVFCFVFASCASTSRSGYEVLPSQKTTYTVELENVAVNIEYIEENVLAEQIFQIMDSKIPVRKESVFDRLFLDIQINQRSYYENITQYNSIYTFYTLTDGDGNCVLKNGIYKKTSDSIASSVLQCSLSTLIAADVKSFISRSEKIVPKNDSASQKQKK